ncbi:hypothetical protein Ahy_A06g027351 [Arachis hypogaea]|uniref:F-box domain-containing protein n=1 Tax=Arachis hypogaea TaxID=3818 RepID=A0A445CNC7_ARAHY|nr:hypothetical protein Ahy_A06g027351 [Arachis hypogaea]
MERVPEDCFAHILSFASPQDACSLCLVSTTLQSMADSDCVWEKFLPLDCQEIVSRIVNPSLSCSSNKKHVFVTLCRPQLIDGGNKAVSRTLLSHSITNNRKKQKQASSSHSPFSFVDWVVVVVGNSSIMLIWQQCLHGSLTPEKGHIMQSDAIIIVNYLKVALGSSGGGANMNFLKTKFIFALSPVVAQIFWIEKNSGKICYQLSARELSIAWGKCPLYWSWKPVEGSRFEEAAELRTICWLEMNGSISTGMLSPKTLYGAYLKVKIADRAYGLDSLPSHVSVELPNYKSHGTVYIRRPSHTHEEWLEIELGSFYTGLDKEVVKMGLKEVKGVHLKGGLIVDGIEIRPKMV